MALTGKSIHFEYHHNTRASVHCAPLLMPAAGLRCYGRLFWKFNAPGWRVSQYYQRGHVTQLRKQRWRGIEGIQSISWTKFISLLQEIHILHQISSDIHLAKGAIKWRVNEKVLFVANFYSHLIYAMWTRWRSSQSKMKMLMATTQIFCGSEPKQKCI